MENQNTFVFACEAASANASTVATKVTKNFNLPDYMLGDNLRMVAKNNTNLFSN